jgi:predicted DNA-binding transcriptional regulator YafY
MPANKYALLRYRVIDRCLTNRYRPFPSLEDLQRACEEAIYGSSNERISASTVEKDMRAMRNEEELGYYAPIKYSKIEKGYYYEDPDYTIRDISLSYEEQEAIKLAAATLFQFRDMAVFKDFGSAIQKIFDRMNISPEMEDEAVERHVQFETTPVAQGSELLPTLLGAIKQHQEVRFRYLSFLDGSESERRLHPYLLKEYRNRWYVIGKDVERNGTRTFGLDRIMHLSAVERYFTTDPDFDPEALFRHSFGITAGGSAVEVTLRFGKQQGQFIRTQPLHPTQQILSEDGQGLVVRIAVIPSPELTMTILSFGQQVEVLTPDALRQEVADALAKATGHYLR